MKFKPLDEVSALLEKIAQPMGIEIVEVALNDRQAVLTVYIETAEGVYLDTCEKYHNAISDPLDELDVSFGEPYTLNVSSPGLDRPFKTYRDYERNLGKEVEIKLYAPLKGKKFVEGVLEEFDENAVTITTAKETLKIQRNKIAKINKAIRFDD
ncbi:MAG: ribosome maturation factor RimP [Candidatus Coproplasma sp.]